MKLALKIATVLAVGLMLTVSQAFAAPAQTWSINDTDAVAVTPNYLDITNVTVAANGGNYDISMALNGDIGSATTGLELYQVNFGNTESTLFTDPTISTLAFKFKTSSPVFYAENLETNSEIPIVSGNVSTVNNKSTLIWFVNQSFLNDNMNYFAGQTSFNGIVKDITPASTTPIPGAIWLLGSGIMGLVGLRRRQTGKHPNPALSAQTDGAGLALQIT